MKILLATIDLERTGGTENFTYAMATALKRLGYDVEYYCFVSGEIARKIEALGIPFMSHSHYDLIIANHLYVVDRLCGKGPIIQTCHGVIPPIEQPSPYADILVGISEEIKDHVEALGFPICHVIHNGIDCQRFKPTKELHPHLSSVLSLCQADEAHQIIKECCEELGVEFHRSDKTKDNNWDVESLVNNSDMVIGIGRSIYDAMACGRTIIAFDYRSYNGAMKGRGYLTADNISTSLYDNCSGRKKNVINSKEDLLQAMKQYNPADGDNLRQFALENLNVDIQVKKYIQLYEDFINAQKESIWNRLGWLFRRKSHQFYVWQKHLFRRKK